jgi:two-component system, chemotaxis family, chemotaxis protein CheY
LARIFTISDNLLIRTLLREILGSAGHQVVGETEHRSEAISCVRQLRPELVILDVVLLRRSGLSTLAELRMIESVKAVVVCSAVLDRRNAIAALQLGAKGFILKPFDRRTVLESVDDALSHAIADVAAVKPSSATAQSGLSRDWVDEYRDFVRVEAALPVVVQTEDRAPLDTFTFDVSGGGMLLEAVPLALGARVEFRLDLGSDEPPIAGRARVVRVTDDGRPALQFEQVHIADHERLIDYITTTNAPHGSSQGPR